MLAPIPGKSAVIEALLQHRRNESKALADVLTASSTAATTILLVNGWGDIEGDFIWPISRRCRTCWWPVPPVAKSIGLNSMLVSTGVQPGTPR